MRAETQATERWEWIADDHGILLLARNEWQDGNEDALVWPDRGGDSLHVRPHVRALIAAAPEMAALLERLTHEFGPCIPHGTKYCAHFKVLDMPCPIAEARALLQRVRGEQQA